MIVWKKRHCFEVVIMRMNEYLKSIFGTLDKSKVLSYILLSLIFFVVTIPLILKPEIASFEQGDEACHYQIILTFLDQFPDLDLTDYSATTTPLYHILLTLSAFIVGSGIIQLRLVHSIASLVCLFVVYGCLSKRGSRLKGLLFASILMLATHFISIPPP
jgi:4-amino-4-deoxy-L-arabinose transferase-like glycosyltransferase